MENIWREAQSVFLAAVNSLQSKPVRAHTKFCLTNHKTHDMNK